MQTVDELEEFHKDVLDGQYGSMLQARASKVQIHFAPFSNRLRKVAGHATYTHTTECTLTFAVWAVNQWMPEQVTELLLHEYAHALTLGHGHDATWHAVFGELKAYCNNKGPTRQYYARSQANKAGRLDIDISGRLEACKTIEDCLALRAIVKKNVQGAKLTKALNKIGARALELA